MLPFHLLLQGFRGVSAAISETNLDLIAAGVAFYAMLAVFPAAAAVIALFGFFADPGIVEEQMALLRNLVPPEAFVIVDQQVSDLIATQSRTLGWATLLSLFAALWSTRAGVSAMSRGLNAIYGTRPRSGVWQTLNVLMMTLLLVGLVICALAVVVVVPAVLAFLPLGGLEARSLELARLLLMVAVWLIGLRILYQFGPNHASETPKRTWPGSVCALLLWGAASWGFSLYVSNFGSYNRVYGSIGAVVILLMWFFISAYAVLLGAALNRALDR